MAHHTFNSHSQDDVTQQRVHGKRMGALSRTARPCRWLQVAQGIVMLTVHTNGGRCWPWTRAVWGVTARNSQQRLLLL